MSVIICGRHYVRTILQKYLVLLTVENSHGQISGTRPWNQEQISSVLLYILAAGVFTDALVPVVLNVWRDSRND
jgi:hypothetical protein